MSSSRTKEPGFHSRFVDADVHANSEEREQDEDTTAAVEDEDEDDERRAVERQLSFMIRRRKAERHRDTATGLGSLPMLDLSNIPKDNRIANAVADAMVPDKRIEQAVKGKQSSNRSNGETIKMPYEDHDDGDDMVLDDIVVGSSNQDFKSRKAFRAAAAFALGARVTYQAREPTDPEDEISLSDSEEDRLVEYQEKADKAEAEAVAEAERENAKMRRNGKTSKTKSGGGVRRQASFTVQSRKEAMEAEEARRKEWAVKAREVARKLRQHREQPKTVSSSRGPGGKHHEPLPGPVAARTVQRTRSKLGMESGDSNGNGNDSTSSSNSSQLRHFREENDEYEEVEHDEEAYHAEEEDGSGLEYSVPYFEEELDAEEHSAAGAEVEDESGDEDGEEYDDEDEDEEEYDEGDEEEEYEEEEDEEYEDAEVEADSPVGKARIPHSTIAAIRRELSKLDGKNDAQNTQVVFDPDTNMVTINVIQAPAPGVAAGASAARGGGESSWPLLSSNNWVKPVMVFLVVAVIALIIIVAVIA